MRRAGDWDCPSCSHLNFAMRGSCQQCATPRPDTGEGGAYSGGGGGSERRPGDWDCRQCKFVNYATRVACKSCGIGKEGQPVQQQGYGQTQFDDYLCNSCGFSNFGRNAACLKCGSPRHAQQRAFGGSKVGRAEDWQCQCGDVVFGNRFSCRKCGCPRPAQRAQFASPYSQYYPEMMPRYPQQQQQQQLRPGDWVCTCGDHVFANRGACRNCGALKPVSPNAGPVSTAREYPRREGDWDCACGYQNFASRSECKQCQKPRPG